MKVKICGITTLSTALAAVEAGADILGYNFYPRSKRYISIRNCARIQDALRKAGVSITAVGVFVNASYKKITEIIEACELDMAQLSGDEPPSLMRKLSPIAFKGIRPNNMQTARAQVQQFAKCNPPPAFLVDTFLHGQYGGTGQTGNWDIARELSYRYPLLLAGGLNSENVAEAVERIRPWGVDVASGVERSPGDKDPVKIRTFVRRAKNT